MPKIESLLYEKYSNISVRCNICQRRCFIKDNHSGFCQTRINEKGKLYSLIYGEVATWHRAPIEIKPVYHYLPGSYAMSVGSLGCNFMCPGCQNWELSFARTKNLPLSTQYLSPEELVNVALQNDCQGLSWTYNEPALWFEYTLAGAKLAKSSGLYTNYVTNGYMTTETLDAIGPYLDILRVDIKAFNDQTYKKIANIAKWRGILDIIKRAKYKWSMHIEIVTNVIPGLSDDKKQMSDLAQWIKKELDQETPWHITRFYPHWQLKNINPTPVQTLETICAVAKAEGLNYIYTGNVPGHPYNHTYCKACAAVLIDRSDPDNIRSYLKNSRCPFCGQKISGRFQ